MAVTGVQGGNSPYIIILEGSSNHGLISVRPPQWGFGKVKVISAGCNQFSLDDSVFFNKEEAKTFRSGSLTYSVVDQKHIFFTETP